MPASGSAKTQYLGTLFANLNCLSYGALCGWASPTFPLLQSEETPLEVGPLSNDQVSWIGSLLCLGGLLGSLSCGWLMDKLGRKMSICALSIPQIISWLLIVYAKDETYLYFSRILGGLAGGGLFVVVPTYIAEIAETRVRGFLGSMIVLVCNFGVFLAYVAGAYLDYVTLPLLFIPLSILTLVGFSYLPETPAYLAKNGKFKEAEESLRFYRDVRGSSGLDDEVFFEEIAALKKTQIDEESADVSGFSLDAFKSRAASRALVIGLGLYSLNQFCGLFAMLNYTVTIFKAAGSTLSAELSAIIVGFIQILGSCAPTLLVERAGRKFLILISAIGICLGQAVLGTYTLLDAKGFDVASFNFVPLLSFAFVIFIGSWGVITLPFLVLSEITPPKIRAFANSLCMSVLWIVAFGAIKLLPYLMDILGMYGTMYLFASFCLLGALFVVILMPETKGKSFDEITKLLEK